MSAVLTSINLDIPEIDFTLIYETFCDKVYRVAIRITRDAHLAEDIMQETFIKAFNKLDTIADLDKIGAWLSTIASRTAIDLIRKEKRAGTISVEDVMYAQDETKTDHYCDVETEAEHHWLEEEIRQEIQHLKPDLKDVFLLKFENGYKEEEIAEYLHLPKGTVKSRLYRARQQLKTGINKGNAEVISA
ncbi:RNA polymerase sigma factor [Alkalihalobacillus sp. AL-G]|uniref:RNA polymerase sigma factor n=1 Tax=Alkalihalobacillus sp. AL-G TaxID=2926399 RepID=UPI00272D4089|nr:RNA polymerase sigma factor [Alkalihalobacillus sp. AL-G]WLD91917.1 RNA polymerase sigma factor [Alkalihalobacillus sp. AL-G]